MGSGWICGIVRIETGAGVVSAEADTTIFGVLLLRRRQITIPPARRSADAAPLIAITLRFALKNFRNLCWWRAMVSSQWISPRS